MTDDRMGRDDKVAGANGLLEPTIRSRHQFGGARISIMETGTFVIGAHAGYLTTLAVGKGIDVGIHMTRDEARDLLTVLQEALA